jgi:hypothetical protein
MMRKAAGFLMLLMFLSNCQYLAPEESQKQILARVNTSYLYLEDIRDLLGPNMTKEDSILIIQNQINKWATQQLLIDQAKINLSLDLQSDLEELIQQYRIDLYTESYKGKIVTAQLDSVIGEHEMRNYYELNKDNFKLNEALVRCRYVHLDGQFLAKDEVKNALSRYDSTDRDLLDQWRLQFKSVNLNDSLWVRQERLRAQIPALAGKSLKALKNVKISQFEDSLGLYLLKIEDVLDRNDVAPLSYVAPTIRQIILNRRKQELTLKLEKDIAKDAIRNKTFEIYGQD